MSRNLLASAALVTSMSFLLAGCPSLDGGGGDNLDVAAAATPPPATATPPATTVTVSNQAVTSGNLSSSTGPATFLSLAADGRVTTSQGGTVSISVGDRSFRQVNNQQAQDAVGGNENLLVHIANNPNDSIFLVEQSASISTNNGPASGPSFTNLTREIIVTSGCTLGDGCNPTATFSVGDFTEFNVTLADGTSVTGPELVSGAVTVNSLDGAQLVVTSVQSNAFGNQQFGDFATYQETTSTLSGTIENPVTGPDVGTYGATFGGQATPESTITQQATDTFVATYSNGGRFEGTEFRTDGVTDIESSSINLVADFDAGTVEGQISNIREANSDQNTVARGYDIGIKATIAGNTFSGDANYIVNNNQISGVGTSQGGFFGPNAEEVAGVVQVTGQAPNEPNTTGITGGFAARQTSQN